MPRFFLPDISGDIAAVTGDDAAHIAKSLRMRPGEDITLCDGNGGDYLGKIVTVSPALVEVLIQSREASRGEPGVHITLFQALPKADKLEFIVQKAVELGARAVIPVLSARCVSRPDIKAMERKRERLNKTALEAAKQSGRGVIPSVGALMDFPAAVGAMGGFDLPLFFYEHARTPLRNALEGKSPRSAALMIGSEGGFSPGEAAMAAGAGIPAVSLGPRVLRCETAPIAAISALMYALGEC